MTKQSNTQQNEHFDNLSSQWWNESGAFGILHAMNPVRVKFIKDIVKKHLPKDLSELTVLDVGCGGGILCEPLARLQAKVTGIDASPKAIECAKEHAIACGLNIEYINCELDNIDQKYDLITCLEMLEHVDDVELICKQLAGRLNANGVLVLSTINKTILSYLVGIVGAEYLTGMVPVGTHNWQQFIEPSSLINFFSASSISPLALKGISYSLPQRNWYLSDSFKVNYILALKAV